MNKIAFEIAKDDKKEIEAIMEYVKENNPDLTKKEIDQIEENTLNKIEKELKVNDREYNMDEIKAKINGTNKKQEIIKSIYDKLNSLPEQEVEQTYELIQQAQKIGPKGLVQVTKILKEHNESKEEKAKANEKNDQEQER